MKPAIVISTFPDKRAATKIANELVRDGVVACVNMSPISSVYLWKGRIHNDNECLAIFKTSQKNKSRLKKSLAQMHPYDVPEIAEINVRSINQSYMRWIEDSAP